MPIRSKRPRPWAKVRNWWPDEGRQDALNFTNSRIVILSEVKDLLSAR
jgi:hypothetical protein